VNKKQAIRKAIDTRYALDWKLRWSKGTKGQHTRHISPFPTKEHLKAHRGREKFISSLIVQLRTGKIGFNAFLHDRKVPTITSPGCDCGDEKMTVEHVLLKCPSWREERAEVLGSLQEQEWSSSGRGCRRRRSLFCPFHSQSTDLHMPALRCALGIRIN